MLVEQPVLSGLELPGTSKEEKCDPVQIRSNQGQVESGFRRSSKVLRVQTNRQVWWQLKQTQLQFDDKSKGSLIANENAVDLIAMQHQFDSRTEHDM